LKKFVIIVAGGKGRRMLADIPKQFHVVAGKPLLMHTLYCFYSFNSEIEIILVLPKNFHDLWQSLILRYAFNIPHQVVLGGETRYESVKNGLQHIAPNSIVAVHDGVRPLVNHETIHRVFDIAEKKGNAIPVVAINESLRKVKHNKNSRVDRNHYFLVQTPQCFTSNLLLKAYEKGYQEDFTDDASLVEHSGVDINLVEGNHENIKVTRPADIKIVEALLS